MLDFAIETARAAGQLLRDRYHEHHVIRSKSSPVDLVTEADVASEQLIVGRIRQQFPDHAILTEEGSGQANGSAYTWLIDPLDGTTNYAHGYPVWAVVMALAQADTVLLGVTYDPLRDELFATQRGAGAFLNDRRLRVSTAARLGESLVATGFPYDRATNPQNNLGPFNHVMPRVRGVRRGGAAALDMAYVAAGRLDGYWEFRLNPWDWAAGSLLVTEAGGTVTDVAGASWRPGLSSLVATNGLLHAELLGAIDQGLQAKSNQ
ncbi:MAG: inositol monophosphatase [Chloroflexi bacterium]|nr:inositol monophosphatase [Chloroflexota bacterium]MBU1748945.1 inositol monophosphatase [Chloroflexota bacterium]MBU1879921.1 inositol monophosphatase [Chloroflexota bacterium]